MINPTKEREYFYRNVTGLGNVAISRHALAKLDDCGISQETFENALLRPTRPDVPDGHDIVWRERDGLRLVVLLSPEPDRGARLVKTVYRVTRQARAK